MTKLVREALSFQKHKDPKRTLLGLIPGQLVKYLYIPDGEFGPEFFVGIFFDGDGERDQNVIILGTFSSYDIKGIPKTLILSSSSAFTKKIDEDELKLLSLEEKAIVKKILNSPRGKQILNYIEKAYLIKPLFESLSFEKKKDPKSALGVGLEYHREFKTFDEAAQFFWDHIDKLSNGIIKSQEQYLKIRNGRLDKPTTALRLSKEYLEGYYDKLPSVYIEEANSLLGDGYFKTTPAKLQYLKIFHTDALGDIIRRENEKRNIIVKEEMQFKKHKNPKEVLFGMIPGQLLVSKIPIFFTQEKLQRLELFLDVDTESANSDYKVLILGDFVIADNGKILYFRLNNFSTNITTIYYEPKSRVRKPTEEEIYHFEEVVKVEEKPEAIQLLNAINKKYGITPKYEVS